MPIKKIAFTAISFIMYCSVSFPQSNVTTIGNDPTFIELVTKSFELLKLISIYLDNNSEKSKTAKKIIEQYQNDVNILCDKGFVLISDAFPINFKTNFL